MTEPPSNDPDRASQSLKAARLWTQAMEQHDAKLLASLLANNFTAIVNFDERPQDKDQFLITFRRLNDYVTDLRVTEVISRQPTPSGFVEERVVECKTMKGRAVRHRYCVVATLDDDGLISRFHTYEHQPTLQMVHDDAN